MRLILENVRCFAGRHKIPIKPLTILVGENSSGKTTFLAALSVVHQPFGFPWQPWFNEPPYSLGNFDTIATYKGGQFGRAKSFALGFARDEFRADEPHDILATYRNRSGQPTLSVLMIQGSRGELHFRIEEDAREIVHLLLSFEGKAATYEIPIQRTKKNLTESLLVNLGMFFARHSESEGGSQEAPYLFELLEASTESPLGSPLSIAPIRTKPKRTYDEVTEEFSPEGEHIPFVLFQRLKEEAFVAALERFGQESGLFKRIDVKQLGDRPGDPFQIQVTSSGRPANLIDVGYGVSQTLPIVVQSVLAAKERMILLQQPEVHLHPKAQAALGSFFVDMVTEGGKQFVVETHSDYIVDRIRIEVAQGRIAPDQVEILYFEKQGMETTVHVITLDECGNILDAPPTYREFFLRETMNLIQRTSK